MQKLDLFNKDTIVRFYKLMNFTTFNELSEERRAEIDAYVNKWRFFFNNRCLGLRALMTFTAEKMISSNGYYGPKTSQEKMYFYIKMVDPQLYFLEAHESANTMEEERNLCLLNFRIYDPYLIKYEKVLQRELGQFQEELWTLDRIKRG